MLTSSGQVTVAVTELDPVLGTSGSFLTVTVSTGAVGGTSGGGGAVDSVNGDTGVVVLDATDVGADPAGTATAAVAAHAAAGDPHAGYLTTAEGNAAYDAAGAAATAQTAAEATASTALATHSADTTAVHGIADTTALVLTDDARLTNSRTPTAHATSHQDGGSDELALDGSQITSGTVADARIAATIARDSEVTAAVSAHEADTTSVHGIADTSALETTTGAQAKVDAHTGDATAAHAATAIAFTPAGTIAATTVQAAIEEVASEASGSSPVQAWTAWTPVLTAATTNPTLGAGSVSGRYMVTADGTCHGWGIISFGAGATAGSGQYMFDLPVDAHIPGGGSYIPLGSAQQFDVSATDRWHHQLTTDGSNADRAVMVITSLTSGVVTNANPIAPASGDNFSFTFTYEAA